MSATKLLKLSCTVEGAATFDAALSFITAIPKKTKADIAATANRDFPDDCGATEFQVKTNRVKLRWSWEPNYE